MIHQCSLFNGKLSPVGSKEWPNWLSDGKEQELEQHLPCSLCTRLCIQAFPSRLAGVARAFNCLNPNELKLLGSGDSIIKAFSWGGYIIFLSFTDELEIVTDFKCCQWLYSKSMKNMSLHFLLLPCSFRSSKRRECGLHVEPPNSLSDYTPALATVMNYTIKWSQKGTQSGAKASHSCITV